MTAYKNFCLRRYSLALYLTQNFISAPATFARREAYQRHPFREDYAMSMDYDVFLQLAQAGDPIVLDRDLACFRMMEGTLSMSSFERQFAEHAEQARDHGAGHPIPVAVNQAMSRLIVLVYRALRAVRRPSRRGSAAERQREQTARPAPSEREAAPVAGRGTRRRPRRRPRWRTPRPSRPR